MSFSDTLLRLNRAVRYEQSGIDPTKCCIDRRDLLELLSDWERLDKEIRELTKPQSIPMKNPDPAVTAHLLAGSLDAFWNAALGAVRQDTYSSPQTLEVIGAMAQGFAAVAHELREGGA